MKKTALLLVVVFVLVIISTSISSSSYLPPRCNFGSGFLCESYYIDWSDNETLRFILQNNLGTDISICFDEIGDDYFGIICTDSVNNCYELMLNDQIEITFDCPGFEEVALDGDRHKFIIKGTWYTVDAGPLYSHDLMGEVYSTIGMTSEKQERAFRVREILLFTTLLLFTVIIPVLFIASIIIIFISKKWRKWAIAVAIVLPIIEFLIVYSGYL